MEDELDDALTKAKKKRKQTKYEEKIEQKYPKNLHKELLGWRDNGTRIEIAPELSLYRSWWEFMRAAEDHPIVEIEAVGTGEGTKEKAKRLKETTEAFGKLGRDFLMWWKLTGQNVFAEETIPLIQVIKPEPDDEEYKREHGVIMIVPMTISRPLLMQQFKIVLDVYHPNDQFKRHAASTSQLKLYPRKRDIDVDYDQMLKIWRAKRANVALNKKDQKSDWEIYCDALGLDNLKLELSNDQLTQENREIVGTKRQQMARTVNNLYAQADELMRNALLGQFPNDQGFQQKKGRKVGEERKKDAKKIKIKK